MMLNIGKTKEIVFHRPHPRKFSLPPKLTDIEQVSSSSSSLFVQIKIHDAKRAHDKT